MAFSRTNTQERAPCEHQVSTHRHGVRDAKHTTDLDRLHHYAHCSRTEAIKHRIRAIIEKVKDAQRVWGKCEDYPPAGSQAVHDCIAAAAAQYGQSYSAMLSLASCESGLNPRAYNASSASGLFQILYPSTWNTTPYSGQDPFSARWNSLAAAAMLAQGRRGEWVC